MTGHTLPNKRGITEGPIDNASDWNCSLISRKSVRKEYIPYPSETEDHCQKRAMIALCVFLATVVVLASAAFCLIWMKIL